MVNMNRLVILTLLPAAALILAACGGSSQKSDTGATTGSASSGATTGSASSATTAAAVAANPVDILRKIPGCVLAPGETQGDHDVQGDRTAECNFLDNNGTEGTNISVYTWATTEGADKGITDDSHKAIVGDHFDLMILGDFPTYSAHIVPSKIAALVGGVLVP
jgi:hypothetical protein